MAPLGHCCGVGSCLGDGAERKMNHTNKLKLNVTFRRLYDLQLATTV